jgi:hypothetical protein
MEIEDCWGGYDRSAWNQATSTKLVVVAVARAGRPRAAEEV